MEREAEIDLIKHDLKVLRARHAGYQSTARFLKWICIVSGLILAATLVGLAVKIFLFDALYGLSYVVALLIFVPALVWMIRNTNIRWIDLASPRLRGIYDPEFFKTDGLRRRSRSEADATEQQISDYERHLSELEEH